ncbi:hypothetical protein [Demequina aurantiaca]|uniref:hypothetical protein n=1 Tax=Demequina aurantiaca TaxID=676200 RepID=UPI003D34F658
MAALNRPKLAVSALIATTALILSSCSSEAASDSPASASQSAEPTVASTVAPSLEASPPATSPQEYVLTTDGTVPDGMAFPSTQDDYVFSAEPQGEAEQWIHDSYPELWDAGVRAVVSKQEPNWDMTGYQPSTLAQYVDGVKYVGSEKLPLGFGIHASNVNEYRADGHAAVVSGMKDSSQNSLETGNPGFGGYMISILENPQSKFNGGNDTEVQFARSGISGSVLKVPTMFESPEEAWAWVQDNNFTPPGGDRALTTGEISAVKVMDETGSNQYNVKALNPTTGKFETVTTVG